MKYQQRDFNFELMEKIKDTEIVLQEHIERLLGEYKSIFAKKHLNFDVGFDQEGKDPFTPGYCSSVSIGLLENSDELIALHTVKIWECERTFFGIPVSKNIPGSKITGELLDETIEEIKLELKDYLEEQLVDGI